MTAFKWYFSASDLQSTPSRKHGVDFEKELSYRQQSANFIQDMGQRLQVTQLCINTAIVYMQRFYILHSFKQFHRNPIAAASLFLAAKVEEQPRKLEHVIKVAHICLHRDQPQLDSRSDAYLEQAQELVANENILLQTLGFDVAIDHPHTHVVRCCQLVKASKDLAQTSYFMATNSLHLTTMCLRYSPTVVACVCIHLACRWSNYKIPLSAQNKQWFEYIDPNVSLVLLNELTSEFLTIFEKCPSRLKKKIMASSQATKEEEDRRAKSDIAASHYQPDFSRESTQNTNTVAGGNSRITSHNPQTVAGRPALTATANQAVGSSLKRIPPLQRLDKPTISHGLPPASYATQSDNKSNSMRPSGSSTMLSAEEYRKRKEAERHQAYRHQQQMKLLNQSHSSNPKQALPQLKTNDNNLQGGTSMNQTQSVFEPQFKSASDGSRGHVAKTEECIPNETPSVLVPSSSSNVQPKVSVQKSIFDIESPVKPVAAVAAISEVGAKVRSASKPLSTTVSNQSQHIVRSLDYQASRSKAVSSESLAPSRAISSTCVESVKSILSSTFSSGSSKLKKELDGDNPEEKSRVHSSLVRFPHPAPPSMPMSFPLPKIQRKDEVDNTRLEDDDNMNLAHHKKHKKHSKKEKREKHQDKDEHRHHKHSHKHRHKHHTKEFEVSPTIPPLKLKIKPLSVQSPPPAEPVPKITISILNKNKRPSGVSQFVAGSPANKMARVLGTTSEMERHFLDQNGISSVNRN